MMMGVTGALLGTRFYATRQALAHANAKDRVIAACGGDTIKASAFDMVRGINFLRPYQIRTLTKAFTENRPATKPAWPSLQAASPATTPTPSPIGDKETAAVIASEAVDAVGDLADAEELVDRVSAEAEVMLRTANIWLE
jgi:nitronate monooxygenase